MRHLVVLLSLVVLVCGVEFPKLDDEEQRSISSRVIKGIEAFREQMPCGFSKYGIPPLVPLKTNYQEIAIDNDVIQAYGEIKNFTMFGLNNFAIVDLNVNPIFKRINFKFNWHNIYLRTHYDMSPSKNGRALRRFGTAKLAFKNFTIWGVAKYNLGLISGKLSVKKFLVYVSLDEVKSDINGLSKIAIINKKLNRIIEEWFMIAVNDNTNNVAELTDSVMVPLLNDMLSDITLLDILSVIGGEASEREPCTPPVDSDKI